jgi:hypothetical protein
MQVLNASCLFNLRQKLEATKSIVRLSLFFQNQAVFAAVRFLGGGHSPQV